MKKHSFENEYAVFWLDENEVIHSDYKENVAITLESAKEELAMCKSFELDGKALSIVDLSPIKSVSKEARNFYAGKEFSDCYTAVALITRTTISRVIGNFFLGINKPLFPVRLFNDKESAIKWLLTFKK